MEAHTRDNLEITLDRQGADRFQKVSYPIRCGRYCAIKTPDYLFEFNLNAEIRYIRGLNGSWPHPAEWLKRTDANDWVFYSTDHDRSLIELIHNGLDRFYSKGAIYLSPLIARRNRRELMRRFVKIKNRSRLPTYLYLIQRL